MKILNLILALILLPVGYVLAQSPRGSHPLPAKASVRLQLLALVDPPVARKGQPIVLKLRLQNISPKKVAMVDSGFYTDYELVVTDTSGKEPLKTKFGLSLPEMPLLRSTELEIAPGEEVQATLEITRIYDLSAPGTYYARATRHSVSNETLEESKAFAEVAFSNPVQFTITP